MTHREQRIAQRNSKIAAGDPRAIYLAMLPAEERSEAAAKWDAAREIPMDENDPAIRESVRQELLCAAYEDAVIRAAQEGTLGYRCDQILPRMRGEGAGLGLTPGARAAVATACRGVAVSEDDITEAIRAQNKNRAEYLRARYGI